mmetsp:Transcript_84003/g.271852  ORF Transcript_84003/g.271852 Transcript_84003/m.271852 type:complete len:375 (+) Transcript_84003:86-1210(+)
MSMTGESQSGATGAPDPEAFKEELAEQQDAAARERAARKAEADRELIHATGEVQTAVALDAAWTALTEALRTDKESIKKVNSKSSWRGLVNLAYLLVIVGCEIDLYGFGMAFQGYWDLDHMILKILLIIGPAGYVLASGMYMIYHQKENERQDRLQETRMRASPQSIGNPYMDSPGEASPPARPPTGRTVTKQPIRLRYYHFVPIVRYYLVVKDKDVDDIEAIFRVNSLSSFSLGLAQVCGIIFYALETGGNFDIFTTINMISQALNWGITLLYFMTPTAARMSAALKVEAVIYNSDKRLRRKFERYIELIDDISVLPSEQAENAIGQFTTEVDNEIMTLANLSEMDLKAFPIEDKFTALKFMRRRATSTYADI